ncbi:hypothetical protein K9692_004282 [Escherichia coli]|jgi:hypothetical protein|uniref:hypothetical protein n=1 Tax=Buttiauxella gaviniae TaxID=82990 RepID=UPI001D840494|nr:hypothetical protein [Escherichia coli]
MVKTDVLYVSRDIVPCRRPKGDLDSRYTPQVYGLVCQWSAFPAQFGEGVFSTYRTPVVQLGYQVKGTRVVLMLIPIESDPEGVVKTDTAITKEMSTGTVMRLLLDELKNIPELNP